MAEDTKPAGPTAAAAAPVDESAVKKNATSEAKTRIAAILSSEEAKGREGLARTIALETDLDAETAKKMLAAAPKESAPAAASNPLQAAMGSTPNPKIGSDSETQDEDKNLVAQVLQFVTRPKGKVA